MTDLRLDDLTDLTVVVRAMDDVGAQGARLADYLRAWVCRREGFETSDACVFRPVGRGLAALAGAFDDFSSAVGASWSGLTDGVATTHRSLADLEDELALRFGSVPV